ncbi:MAG TPA: PIN domain-containing protein [Bryobacteraceae bacterium]|nr:PIN domain-containing protein [Bryobacteraceae bacterium]
MNGDKYFVDTNVLLYPHDFSNHGKRAQAKAWLAWLWENASGAISWQVLQEFYWNAYRKFGVTQEVARNRVKLFSLWRPPDVTLGLIERAWHWTDEAQVPFWDAMIVAAAERTRCRFLLSEDFQAGRQFGSVTTLNPFNTSPPAVP